MAGGRPGEGNRNRTILGWAVPVRHPPVVTLDARGIAAKTDRTKMENGTETVSFSAPDGVVRARALAVVPKLVQKWSGIGGGIGSWFGFSQSAKSKTDRS